MHDPFQIHQYLSTSKSRDKRSAYVIPRIRKDSKEGYFLLEV
jgi:hypothetical protein